MSSSTQVESSSATASVEQVIGVAEVAGFGQKSPFQFGHPGTQPVAVYHGT